MKKILIFLCCSMALFSSCNDNDTLLESDTNNNNTIKSDKVRWYGVNSVDITEKGVSDKSNLWDSTKGISIKFLNKPTDASMIDQIKTIGSEWLNYADIKFNFVEDDQPADVRIVFDWNGNDWITWSYTGADAKFQTDQTQPTATFGGLEYLTKEEFRGDVLRLFGQILGLEYEQRHQDWTFWRDEIQLERYWDSMFEGINIDWTEVRNYVFTPLDGSNAIYPTLTNTIDEKSIMAWPYYTRAQTTKLIANYELSAGDKEFIEMLYRRKSASQIQELWVDAGFFEWTNDQKTALTITELGAKQDTLPTVTDGEQLITGISLFNYINASGVSTGSKLTKAPKFNSENITDFRNMFLNNAQLKDASNLTNTSKGVDFSGMFSGCSSLPAIPLLDTSNGTNFSAMFYYCTELKKIPLLNTSNGINFTSMFNHCTSLTSIPNMDTSKGTSFRLMFGWCEDVKTFPNLNTAQGTDFGHMFSRCKSMVSAPSIDTSKGSLFDGMFYSCVKLLNVPNLLTSNGTNFERMFSVCSSLKTIPQIEVSKGVNFNYMFASATSLTHIPALNTISGNYFYQMFNKCSALEEKPVLDLSNATNTEGMYAGTKYE